MENNRVWIYKSQDNFKAELIKAVMHDHGIPCFLLNKKDSSYLSFGEIEVYVNTEDAVQALHIINKNFE
jgi:hypothetical protein